MNAIPRWAFHGCLLIFSAQTKMDLGMQYHVRDKPLPDMTIPQASAQVVSPAIYMQLGEQDKAIQVGEAKFAAIDQRFKDEDNSLEKLRHDMKPLEEASVQAHLIIKVISIIVAFLVSIGFLITLRNTSL